MANSCPRVVCALFIFISLLFETHWAFTQPIDNDNHLVVSGEATEDVPADQATLNVNLTYSDEKDVTLVYEQHKAAREKLVGLLNELKVSAKDLQMLQLIVRKERDFSMMGGGMGPPVEKFKSYQRVSIKFNDLKQYAQVQQRLVSDGFSDMTSTFSVSNQQEIELRLSDKAVARAKEKADRLAKAISRSVKRVIRIGDLEENEPISGMRINLNNPYAVNFNGDPMRPAANIPQTFRFSTVVKIVFEMN